LVEQFHQVRKKANQTPARINWAANAQAALEFLATNEFSVDILFSDVAMPGMSGIELAEKVRRTNPDLRIKYRYLFLNLLHRPDWVLGLSAG
jgi:CheY-like chemotaxis protein